METLLNLVGIAGVAMVLTAYLLLQTGRLTPERLLYPLLNIFGSLLIIASLTVAWNLPSFVIQCCWIAISLYGMVRHSSGRRSPARTEKQQAKDS